MADRFATHGRILCGTVTTPDFAGSLADYTGALGLRIVDQSPVPADLAESWGAPATAGRPSALLQGGPEDCFVRLFEGSPAPTNGPGWLAWELTVADAFALREAVRASGFTVIGEPRRVEGFDSFIPFQVQGRGGEVLYLNQVLGPSADGIDLPLAQAPVDRIFIAVLGASDRTMTLAYLIENFGLEPGGSYEIPIGAINRAHTLPETARHAISITRAGTLPVFEVDQLPPSPDRAVPPGELPPGCAFATVAVASIDRIRAPLVSRPERRFGPLYRDRRVATAILPDNILLELVEAP